MPCFRGIEISVYTEPDKTRLPEFPHPDGSSVRLQAPDGTHKGDVQSPKNVFCHLGSESDLATPRPSKVNPRICVYIPSVPGVQFWMKYAVTRPPDQIAHMYFKMFMNGRHIASWGIKPKIQASGTVTRALYEPGERWHYEDNGVVLKREGIESRYFYFNSESDNQSVAEEGGLIEVHVFRAKSRRRQATKLDQFRGQENYGITTPSGGLLDKPEDTTFYEFYLVDPKDSPYATFRFHYRSWTNLRQLNLIPGADLLLTSSAVMSTASPDSKGSSDSTPVRGQLSNDLDFSFGLEDDDQMVFGDMRSNTNYDDEKSSDHLRLESDSYFLKSPPKLRPVSASASRFPQPSKALRDAFPESYLQRPLPELPKGPKKPGTDFTSQRSRRSSTASRAPSITPSLLPYLEDESFANEKVEVGRATQVPFVRSESRIDPLEEDDPAHVVSTSPLSDYNDSPRSSNGSRYSELLSPRNYLASTGSLFEQNTALLAPPPVQSPGPLRQSVSPKARQILGDEVDADLDLPKYGTMTLSESEWMRRTPSPAPQQIPSHPLSRIWSPRPNRNSKKSLFGFSLRRTKSKSPDRSIQVSRYQRGSVDFLLGQDARIGTGNWI